MNNGCDEIQVIIDRLQAGEGAQIGEEAAKGGLLARTVIQQYEFMRKCPGDPGGQAFFLMAYEKWGQSRMRSTNGDRELT